LLQLVITLALIQSPIVFKLIHQAAVFHINLFFSSTQLRPIP
jgi:hypothetical protein